MTEPDWKWIAEQRRKDLLEANRMVEDHARREVAATNRATAAEAEVVLLRARVVELEARLARQPGDEWEGT